MLTNVQRGAGVLCVVVCGVGWPVRVWAELMSLRLISSCALFGASLLFNFVYMPTNTHERQ